MSEQPPRERMRQRPRRHSQPRNAGGIGGQEGSDGGSGGDGGSRGGGPTGSGGGGFNWKPVAAVGSVAALALAAFLAFGGGPAADNVTTAEMQDRTAAYQALVASPGLALSLVSAEDVDTAIAGMPDTVSDEQREQLRSDIDTGRVKLAWLTLWDTHAEDGDILRFESTASFPIEVMALNAKTTIAIPYPADGNVVVTGVRDGGGGITIALESGAARIAWPTMAPGDTLNLPVTQGF